jgi:dTDP-4-dehydrorhamnose reductase
LRVLLTGAAGQLGTAIAEAVPDGVTLVACSRDTLDIADAAAVRATIGSVGPDVIINAAAYTAVDRAESEHVKAFRVNETGPDNLAREAGRVGARLIHFSTDFVFDGSRRTPYRPGDACRPLGVYGASKLAGEEAVRRQLPAALIIRTSWLYSGTGTNFVRTMLRLMGQEANVRVVNDQVGRPTWAPGLARAAWAAVARPDLSGVLHWADAGEASWHEFACAIREEALATGLLASAANVTPISTAEFGSPAPRPPYSVLHTESSSLALGLTPAPWRANLRQMIEGLCRAG